MRLDDLTRVDTQKETRWWANDGGEGENMYLSVVDCPTEADALAAYKEIVGDDWNAMFLPDEADGPIRQTIPCCDHDLIACDRPDTTSQCLKAVMREVWAFEV